MHRQLATEECSGILIFKFKNEILKRILKAFSTMKFHASHKKTTLVPKWRVNSPLAQINTTLKIGGFKRLQIYIVDSQWSYLLKYRLDSK